MNTKIDNRMGWIRNIEKIKKKGTKTYIVEYEIATECRIPGVLDYMDSKILCGPLTMEKDLNGLYHYSLKIEYYQNESYNQGEKNRKGYYFNGGIVGEIMSIFSLYFRCRFYLIATYTGELSDHGLRMKKEHTLVYRACNPAIHPPIFSSSNKNFAKGLSDFLNLIKLLDDKYHQQFILSCGHYARSLKEVGIDSEMVFIRLVSSIESLSQFIKLTKGDDLFKGKKIEDIIKIEDLPKDDMDELKKIFETRKAKVKFVNFIMNNSHGCLRGGNYKAKHCKIKKVSLPKVLSAIYTARSEYLHNGDTMYLSSPIHGGEKWDTDPTVGMTIDNRFFSASQKLPYTYFFEGLVRCCLINFLKNSQNLLQK
jgi:hypothetical protein